MENITHNPIAETAIMALNAHPELLPSFKRQIRDYLISKSLLEFETHEIILEEEIINSVIP